jgi:raffinose/stachyose/melibiose transport system permease protein
MKNKKYLYLLGDLLGIIGAFFIFIIPFIFMFINSIKGRREANLLSIMFPEEALFENYLEVFKANNYILLTAFKNSAIITSCAVFLLIITCSMAGYILARRRDKIVTPLNFIILSGLMVPPAIMPTIWLMQGLDIYKTLFGMVMIEVALQIPFTIMLYRGFITTIPVELEEAGYMDGCTKIKLFTTIVFPLLKPVTATVVILNAVTIFNDFTNPLYFLPGAKNATVQLTLYNFMGQYSSSYNLLFANVIIITVPMLILFIILNRKIVDGMVAGAVKG